MINTTHYTVSQYVNDSRKNRGVWVWAESGHTFYDLKEAEGYIAGSKARYKNMYEQFKANNNPEIEIELAAHMEEIKKRNAYKINEVAIKYTHASHYKYTDVDAFEIVKVISDKTIEIRRMKTDHNIKGLTTHVGGFSGHVANQHDQTVTYESNTEEDVIRIRKKKNSKDWWIHKDMKFLLKESPYAFYDFNF